MLNENLKFKSKTILCLGYFKRKKKVHSNSSPTQKIYIIDRPRDILLVRMGETCLPHRSMSWAFFAKQPQTI